jgi:hypothetical protein
MRITLTQADLAGAIQDYLLHGNMRVKVEPEQIQILVRGRNGDETLLSTFEVVVEPQLI